jgi:4-hydroxy-tetrahydrodipicolinate synthase
LSRGTSPAAQRSHFKAVLSAAPDLPSVIYNSPYYGFATKADLFFALRAEHKNLVGFKEFGGADDLRYAAESITSGEGDVTLMIGVDTNVVHGFVNCGAAGAITGVGNVLPREVLHLVALSQAAAKGDVMARQRAAELDAAMGALSSFDEGLNGDDAYKLHFNEDDVLSDSQRGYAEAQLKLFRAWYAEWSQLPGAGRDYAV